jgi:transposase
VITLRADLKVVVAAHPVDFRKSVHTLSALASETLRANPYCGDVFMFRSKRADRVKLFGVGQQRYGAGDEMVASGGFTWPPIRDGVAVPGWPALHGRHLHTHHIVYVIRTVQSCGDAPTRSERTVMPIPASRRRVR